VAAAALNMKGMNLKLAIQISNKNRIALLFAALLFLCANQAYAQDFPDESAAAAAAQSQVTATMLQGHVHHTSKLRSHSDKPDGSKKLQAAVEDESSTQQLSAEEKLTKRFSLFGRKMTSDDYRKMNYGVLGLVSTLNVFTGRRTVAEVFPDCPAALAGIRKGDIEVQTDDHVWTSHDGQKASWNIADGKAGTNVDMVILRKGQKLTFHLTRMNIEDIQNDQIRRMFERMLRRLGPPSR
jgi:C-terminal processing protease CtpA/Prc